jgi:hypothetical protein
LLFDAFVPEFRSVELHLVGDEHPQFTFRHGHSPGRYVGNSTWAVGVLLSGPL